MKTTEHRFVQQKTRIFLVDDQWDILLFYKAGLEQDCFLVHAFNDPVQALFSFKAAEYDLVILDIKIDGNVKVCFITAPYYESLKEIFDMPNIHYIIKKQIDIRNLIAHESVHVT